MKKILIINACVNREMSRTEYLGSELIKALGDEYSAGELILENEGVTPMSGAEIVRRTALIDARDFGAAEFRYARALRDADVLVFLAPYWDLSFPASLKCFLERASVNGIVFKYDDHGAPVGLCSAESLYYVTTGGGPLMGEDLGFVYVRALLSMYGVKKALMIEARGLDVAGADVEELLSEAVSKIPGLLIRK